MPRAMIPSLRSDARPVGLRPGPRFPGRLAGAFLALLPGTVLACPSCTAHVPESPGRSLLLLGALMLTPLLLVGLGVWAARRAPREGTDAPIGEKRA